jgi:MraZ protein
MPIIESNTSIYYNSTYCHGVDDKRRVQIPAKWRPSTEVEFTLILWPRGTVTEACLLVLPPEEWIALVNKLKAMPFANPKVESLRRLIGTKSDRVALDKAGRICLPEAMAKAVGIESQAMLVGLVDRFQIWNPERYQAAKAEDEISSSDAFAQI